MTLNEIIEMLQNNNSIFFITAIIIVTSLIEVSPLKLNPWSWVQNQIKKMFVDDTINEVKALSNKLDDFTEDINNNISDVKRQTIDLNYQCLTLDKGLQALSKRVEDNEHIQGERYAKNLRRIILEFGDYLYAHPDEDHTKERFDSILIVITDYETYCSTHPDFKNEQAVMTIDFIKHKYQEFCKKHSFL